MDEKIISALIGAASTGIMYGVVALIQHGKNKQKFETLTKDVADLKAEQVKKNEYENELLEVHRRIDNHSKKSDERSSETQKMLADIKDSIAEMKGYIRGRWGNGHAGE